jgi:hypothetical protein
LHDFTIKHYALFAYWWGVDRNKGNYPEKLPSSIGKKLPHTNAGELKFRYLSLEYFSR